MGYLYPAISFANNNYSDLSGSNNPDNYNYPASIIKANNQIHHTFWHQNWL
jgi:hypothetical protein